MSFQLSGYLSPTPHPPSFLIPTFTKHGSNDVFAQNLDISGSVLEFLHINSELFYLVPVLAPCIPLSTGQPGLLAYWPTQDRVIVGSTTSMMEMVSDEVSSDPFCELELGSLMGDEERTRQAMLEAAQTFGNIEIGSKWKHREEAVWNRRSDLFGTLPQKSTSTSKNEVLFQDLVNNPNDESWINIWIQLWGIKYRTNDLAKIALWWMDIGHAEDEIAGAILDTLLRRGKDPSVEKHAQHWLSTNHLPSRWWAGIWLTLRNMKGHGNDAIRGLAVENLRRYSNNGQAMTRSWTLLWAWVWRSHPGRADMIEIAGIGASEASSYSVTSSFVENVAQPTLAYGSRSQSIIDISVSWLVSYPKSTLLWASAYLRLRPIVSGENIKLLQDVAIFWIRTSGGNINKWHDVWITVKDELSDRDNFDIGYKWLLRSRWDLSSWPKVFGEVAAISTGSQIDYLISLGERWFRYPGGSNKSVTGMRQATQYLAEKRDST